MCLFLLPFLILSPALIYVFVQLDAWHWPLLWLGVSVLMMIIIELIRRQRPLRAVAILLGSPFAMVVTLRKTASLPGFWENTITELFGIAITVVVIDELRERLTRTRKTQELKQDLIRQLGSRSNDFALEAARRLRNKGWLKDGSLQNLWLVSANLQDAHLGGAKLPGAQLIGANLQGTDLGDAWLQGANLEHAHLDGACLWGMCGTKLQGATLKWAKLQGANLYNVQYDDDTEWRDAEYDDDTKWPDGFDPEAAGCFLN